MTRVEIEYRVPRDSLDRAVDARAGLLEDGALDVDGVEPLTGEGGVFEVRATGAGSRL